MAWLIQQQGVQPHEIVVITFTKKAALELQDRLALLLGRLARSVKSGTWGALHLLLRWWLG